MLLLQRNHRPGVGVNVSGTLECVVCSLTRVLVDPLLHSVLLLVNPLAVALEVDLRGGRGLAVQVDRFVLHYVGLLRLHQKHGQRLRGVRRKGFR